MALDERFDVGGSGVDGQDIHPESVSTEKLSGVADHVVSTTSGLQSTLSNLNSGDVVFVAQPATPYRTDKWLDIDADGVRVVFQNTHAEDGSPIVTVADGANVGGIRIGVNSPADTVEVVGYGHDGNPTNQTTGTRHHGVIAGANASNVTIRDCYLTRTHPYQQHDDGGSGVTVRPGADGVLIYNNEIEDIGDRGIQLGGIRTQVISNLIHDGYDRSISMDLLVPGDEWTFTEDTVIGWNDCRDNSAGSLIGGVGRAERETETGRTVEAGAGFRNIRLIGNRCENGQRRGIFFNALDPATDRNISIVGNNCVSNPTQGIQASAETKNPLPVTVTGNSVYDAGGNGIGIKVVGGTVDGNAIVGAGSAGIRATWRATISGNEVHNAGDDGIYAVAHWTTVCGNRVEGSGRHGINLNGGSSTATSNVVTGSVNNGILADGIWQGLGWNSLEANGTGSSGSLFEIEILGSESVIANNIIYRGGTNSVRAIDEDSGASSNTYIGNYINHGQSWALNGSGSWAMCNRPQPAGYGYVVTTPDGSAEYEISVDNNGAVTTTQL